MTIIVNNDGSKTVNTITDRNALPRKFSGMKVTVRDATGDPEFGGGSAQYFWDSVSVVWVPIWSSLNPTIKFATEEKVVTGGQVTADNVIKDDKVWQARLVNVNGTIMGDVKPTVSGNSLDLGTTDHDGLTLQFTYAYGDMTAQMAELWFQKPDKDSPTFTGVPRAPTPTVGDDSTQLATTAFVAQALSGFTGGGGAVDSVNGQTGVVVLGQADVGLGSVDNFATATQTQAEAADSDQVFATPLGLRQFLASIGISQDPGTGEWINDENIA